MSQLKIASKWFERKRIDDDITLLWEPHVHAFLRCNIWHVRGRNTDLLIDTGMGVGSLAEAVRDLFEKPVTVILTHTHMDHMGGAYEFDAVCVHKAEAPALAEANNHLSVDIADWDGDAQSWISGMGYDISGGILTAIPHKGFDLAEHRLEPANATKFLQDGDIVDTGDRQFAVLHLPGHSPGSIGLWEAATGTLFSGDAIYDGALLDEIPGSDIPVYRRTMQRLRELPVSVVHAGHDPSFGRERLKQIVDTYLEKRP